MSLLIAILVLFAIVVALLGIMGSVFPKIPGPSLCFASLFTAYFVCPGRISLTVLLVMLALTVLVTVMDYIAPVILTRLGGGSRAATWGAALGVLAGLLILPWGLLIGPLVGAFIGEMIHEARVGFSFKVAAMSLVSFLLTIGLRLFLCLIMTYYTFAAMGGSFVSRVVDIFS